MWHEIRCDKHGDSLNDNISLLHKRSSVLDDLMSRTQSKYGPNDFEFNLNGLDDDMTR